MDNNALMALAGEISRKDEEFKDRVVSQFQELIDELLKATAKR